jgi:hypothetical protein
VRERVCEGRVGAGRGVGGEGEVEVEGGRNNVNYCYIYLFIYLFIYSFISVDGIFRCHTFNEPATATSGALAGFDLRESKHGITCLM